MIRQSLTSLPSLDPIFELAGRCQVADGYSPKVYWNLIQSRRYDPRALDYIYCTSSGHPPQPIALLSAYYFQDGVEVTAMVDPEFRRQGIFKKLLQKALDTLKLYQITSYFLICNAKAHLFSAHCAALGARLHHSEIEMRGPINISSKPQHSLTLQSVDFTDIDMLVKLHQASFPGTSPAMMRERLLGMLKEPNRQIWVAKDLAGSPVGKLHVREDINAIFLHDLGIIPELWQKGYGQSLVCCWYQRLGCPPNKPIMIDVLGDNQAALRLYTSSGFVVTNQYDFWQFTIG